MDRFTIGLLSLLALAAAAWASPGEDDIATCTKHGHSREVCLHSVMP